MWNEPATVPIEPVDGGGLRRRPRSPLRNALGALTALMAVVALALGIGAVSSGDGGGADRDRDPDAERVAAGPALAAVRSALDASTSTGGYELSYEFHTREPERHDLCEVEEVEKVEKAIARGEFEPPEVSGVMEPCSYGPVEVTLTGQGVIHLNPYFLEATSNLSNLGIVTVRTDGSRIVQEGGANYGGSVEGGGPLSGLASLVQGTLGRGPGAFTMLALANNHGYLSLSSNSVTGAQPAGTGEVAGTPVTYYDVTADPAAMLELPNLSDEQRVTIRNALAVLDETGFVQKQLRIAVDAQGYIRESWSEMEFGDGTTMSRHMILYRFGCIGTSPTPVNPTGMPEDLPDDCAPAPTTTDAATTVP